MLTENEGLSNQDKVSTIDDMEQKAVMSGRCRYLQTVHRSHSADVILGTPQEGIIGIVPHRQAISVTASDSPVCPV